MGCYPTPTIQSPFTFTHGTTPPRRANLRTIASCVSFFLSLPLHLFSTSSLTRNDYSESAFFPATEPSPFSFVSWPLHLHSTIHTYLSHCSIKATGCRYLTSAKNNFRNVTHFLLSVFLFHQLPKLFSRCHESKTIPLFNVLRQTLPHREDCTASQSSNTRILLSIEIRT